MTDENRLDRLVEVDTSIDGVTVLADTESVPATVEVWDGCKRVHEPVAALQKEDIIWWAKGYAKAKEEYTEDE